MNEIAPKGKLFICVACLKRSKDLYGDKKIDLGWDESCMLNAVLVSEVKARFLRGEHSKRVVK